MANLDIKFEVEAYVRFQNWLMDYYMRNQAPAPEDLKKQKQKEIRKEMLLEQNTYVLKTLEEISE